MREARELDRLTARIAAMEAERRQLEHRVTLLMTIRELDPPAGWWVQLAHGGPFDRTLRELRGCTVPLPRWAARRLGLVAGATYGQAAALFATHLRHRQPTAEPVPDAPRTATAGRPPNWPVRVREPMEPTELPNLTYAEALRFLAGRPRRCPQCRGPMPPQQRDGRRRRYCSARCRQAAHRAARAVSR